MTAGVAAAAPAHAQDAGTSTSVMSSGSVSVVNPTRTATLRVTTPTTKQHWISHKDCVDDVELTFRITVSTPVTGKYIFAYVGKATTTTSTTVMDSCLYNVARTNPGLCKPLTDVDAKDKAGPIVRISAKKLNALFGIEGCGETAASTAPLSLQFYFLLEPLANDFISGGENYAIYSGTGIDLWGPSAPVDITPVSSDEALKVEFADNSTDGDVAGYYLYVDDGKSSAAGTSTSAGTSSAAVGAGGSGGTSAGVGGATSAGVGGAMSTGTGGGTSTSTGTGSGTSTSTGAGGAGGASSTATGAGGVSGTTAASGGLSTGITGGAGGDQCNPSAAPSCTAGSFVLKSGEVPGEDVKHTEDSLASTSTDGTVSGLVNGKAYVVAVAAFDDVGNVGKLSDLACGTPQPLDTILRVYQCNGGLNPGETGCGFCSVGVDRGNSFAALVSAGLVFFGFAARRSRRTRAERTTRGGR